MPYARTLIATAFIAVAIFGVSGSVIAQAPPAAPPQSDSVMGRLRKVGEEAGYKKETGETTFAEIVGKIISGAMALLGVIFVAQMVYAGWLWMTAAGEEDQITKAKHVIRRSIIGLAIVLSAWAITSFVISRFSLAVG